MYTICIALLCFIVYILCTISFLVFSKSAIYPVKHSDRMHSIVLNKHADCITVPQLVQDSQPDNY
jgi:hypothetical protein